MLQYIYFVKCPNCEDEPFDFFDEAKEFACSCMSKKPIITQVEVDRNDFGECVDSCDLGTVWSWEDIMKETDAEPTISIFTKDDLVKNYDPDNDPEFADLDDCVCGVQCDPAFLQENIQSEINQGDLVDFGTYGQLYVCNPTYSSDYYWVTDLEEDRNDKNASGWSIKKDLAKRIIDSCFDESCKKPIPEGMTIEQLVEEMEENEDTVECTWCNDLFDKDQCRKEVNLGYLCSRCEAAIKSRGEKLTFEENNYWDFLDEDSSFSEGKNSTQLQESAENLVEFEYDNLDITLYGNQTDADEWDEIEYSDEYTYKVDRAEVEGDLWDFLTEDDVKYVPGGLEALEDDAAWANFLETHFDSLLAKYYDKFLDLYRERAAEEFAENYNYFDYMDDLEANHADSLYDAWRDEEFD